MKIKKKRQLREKALQRKTKKQFQKAARELLRNKDRYIHGTLLPAEEKLFRNIRRMYQEKAPNMGIEDKMLLGIIIILAVPHHCFFYLDKDFTSKLTSVLAECIVGDYCEKKALEAL